MNRLDSLKAIDSTACWDVVVIGGGATGLGTALEAASRGYKTLLLEQADFAKSTSSKSTKLVHGGVRYLAQGNISLVREANKERGRLYKNAPHLVKNQRFIIPVYTLWDRLKYTLGLKLYDWIAGRLSMGSSLFITKKQVTKKLPNLATENLVGGVVYHDGQFDDSRLAINLAQSIFDNGGFALNYFKVEGFLKNTDQKICGVKARDIETEQQFLINTKSVVNATGVFSDEILQMDDADATKSICVSQGVHLVLDKQFLRSDYAMMIPETVDGRVLFLVPWYNKIVVGTTDTPVNEFSLEPVALQEEIDFILTNASIYLKEKPRQTDILSIFAGLRPLAAPTGTGKKTKEISRSHKIMVTASGLFSIIGGKWTTYRKMGEDVISRIEKESGWKPRSTKTSNLRVHGYKINSNSGDPLNFYGTDADRVRLLMGNNATGWIGKNGLVHQAQVQWAAREEMARNVEDVLARRTRCLLLDARESISMARSVAEIMATELSKSEQWVQDQVDAYSTLASRYLFHYNKSS